MTRRSATGLASLWSATLVMWACVAAGLLGHGSALSAQPAQKSRPDYSSGPYLYRTFCATCHGLSGQGDGPTAPVLRTPPPDLTTLTARAGGVFPRDRVLAAIDGRRTPRAHGPAEMPIWGDVLRSTEGTELVVRQRIEAIATYLESLQVR